jgi:transcription elongation GreA/GreB family factor/very-short-patch-repair endonuclease
VAELLEERIKTVPEGEQYRERWEKDGAPLFVKNLENVQGDERDAIIISTTYGRGQGTEVVRQNFGPISRGDGWRRLNVLFTRARRSVLVVSSMKPEDVVVDSVTPEGTRQLHHYLKYAKTGYLHSEEPIANLAESDFEAAIIDVLKVDGYEVTPQLGVAGFRIDIAVRHPDHPSVYLAAVECDGATYHSGISVRDRDRIRQEVLESLGWKGRIWRIWSTDWFRNPKAEMEKLLHFLSDLRAKPIEAQYEAIFQDQDKLSARFAATDVAASPLLVEEDRGVEIGVGDVVIYVDQTTDAHAELTLRITQKITDFERGLVARHMPLAQALLGASPGETVVLRGPGKIPRSLQIRSVTKSGASPQHPE